jgi:hypothetical protein
MIRIRDEHPGSYFRGHRNNFLGLKILKFFVADPEPGYGTEIRNRDPEPRSGTEIRNLFDPGSGIWDGKKFGSGINIPDHATLSKNYIFL